jgi:hypothetical protein
MKQTEASASINPSGSTGAYVVLEVKGGMVQWPLNLRRKAKVVKNLFFFTKASQICEHSNE